MPKDPPREHYDLADDCHEVGLKYPHGNDVRKLLLDCRHRIVADAETIRVLKQKLYDIYNISQE